MQIHLITLGTLSGTAAGRDLTWLATQRVRAALLVYLAVEREATRDTLLALLWPEQDAEKARHSLSQTVYLLRRSLGNGWLDVHGNRLTVTDALQVDALDFAGAVERGAWDAAVASYGGPFLHGLYLSDSGAFESWVEGQRARLERLHRRAQRERVNERVAAEDAAGALAAARAWVERNPLEDEAQHRLIELLVHTGQRTEGLAQYDSYVRVLAAEELTPLDETRALAEQLRAGEVALLPWSGSAAVAPSAGAGASTSVDDAADAPHSPQVLPVGSTDGGQHSHAPRVRHAVRRTAALAAGAIVVAGILGVMLRSPDALHTTELDPDVVAVLPFRVIGADPALAVLREGMVDLLATKLSMAGGVRAVDPRTLLAAMRRAQAPVTMDLSPDSARALAARLGAGRLLLGSLVSTGDRATLSGALVDVADGQTIQHAVVEGPADSLLDLVDGLAARVLITATGEPESRLDALTTTSLPALHAYLRGRSANRRGAYEVAVAAFNRALQLDSTFNLAVIGLAESWGWTGQRPEGMDRALSLALADQERLPEPDRLLLLQIAHGEPGYLLGAADTIDPLQVLERLVTLVPDRPEAWYHLGEYLIHNGGVRIGRQPSIERAQPAFAKALALDPEFAPAAVHVIDLAISSRDTALLRRDGAHYLAVAGNLRYQRWLVAGLLRDTTTLTALRDSMAPLDFLEIVGATQGSIVGLTEADAAVALLEQHVLAGMSEQPEATLARAAIAVHNYSLNRGRPARARRIAAAMPPALAQIWPRITDALYWDGEPAAADTAVRILLARLHGGGDRADGSRPLSVEENCALQQWRILHHDTIGVAGIIARMDDGRTDPRASRPIAELCRAVLDVLLALERKRPAAIRSTAAHLDSLRVRAGDYPRRRIAAIVSARAYEAIGDTDNALRVIRARNRMEGTSYLSTILREEARLALAAGDTAETVRAYTDFIELRARPEPRLQAQTDSARAALARLRPDRPPRRPAGP